MAFFVKAFNGVPDACVEVRGVFEILVGQVVPLEVVPAPLDLVVITSVRRCCGAAWTALASVG